MRMLDWHAKVYIVLRMRRFCGQSPKSVAFRNAFEQANQALAEFYAEMGLPLKTWSDWHIYHDLLRWRANRFEWFAFQRKGVEYCPHDDKGPGCLRRDRGDPQATGAGQTPISRRPGSKRSSATSSRARMRRRDPDNPSLETVRQLLAKTDKFEHKVALLGERYAIQTVRPIGSLHTYYPGQRTELDYTKFGLYLYPTEHWNEPQVYVQRLRHRPRSAVCKGYTITTAPAARDAIRLYRNCVLPKSLWLPDALKSKANAWDVFGIEELIAIDNGMDLIADAAILVFIHHGVIVLRIPPKRGDLKGKVERFIGVVEQQFVKPPPGLR